MLTNQIEKISTNNFNEFARKMIDAGADVAVGHGPHVLRGIEIYKEKPIFYSLANFMFQMKLFLEFLKKITQDITWELMHKSMIGMQNDTQMTLEVFQLKGRFGSLL